MNFLGHLVLAERTPPSATGALLGDFLKGAIPADLPPEVARGVREHRATDSLMARHPAVTASVARHRAKWGRLTPVLYDLYSDVLVSERVPALTGMSLEQFVEQSHALLEAGEQWMPPLMLRVTRRLREGRWMLEASTEGGLARMMTRLETRLSWTPTRPLSQAAHDFLDDTPALRPLFDEWFADARAMIACMRVGA